MHVCMVISDSLYSVKGVVIQISMQWKSHWIYGLRLILNYVLLCVKKLPDGSTALNKSLQAYATVTWIFRQNDNYVKTFV
jgi:hypothetical protein